MRNVLYGLIIAFFLAAVGTAVSIYTHTHRLKSLDESLVLSNGGTGTAITLPEAPAGSYISYDKATGGIIVVTPPSPMCLADKVKRLRAEAKKRHLHWEVICTGGNGPYGFQADAFRDGTVDYGIPNHYYEDGVRDWWSVLGGSEEAVIDELYKAIQNPPNVPVHHRPIQKPKHDGCNYQIVLSSQQSTNIPCGRKSRP